MSSISTRLLLGVVATSTLLIGVEPAHAETIRVPWPIWVLIEGFYFVAWAAAELWALLVAGFNAFWAFILFVVFVPLPKLILGIVVTLGGAFLPSDVFSGTKAAATTAAATTKRGKAAQADTGTIELSAKKVAMKGPARYAVCLVGLMIVASSLWQFSSPPMVSQADSEIQPTAPFKARPPGARILHLAPDR